MVAIRTTTVESLLGVLSLQPMSGYEIRRFIERSTANFWSESFGQIYPALKRMLADGLVAVEDGSGEGHPTRKVYSITEAGRAHLRAWLAVPARPRVDRSEMLLKVFFGDKAGPGAIRAHVETARERAVAELQQHEGTVAEIERLYPDHPGMPFWRMTLRLGIAEARANAQWADETLRELDEMGDREKAGL